MANILFNENVYQINHRSLSQLWELYNFMQEFQVS